MYQNSRHNDFLNYYIFGHRCGIAGFIEVIQVPENNT